MATNLKTPGTIGATDALWNCGLFHLFSYRLCPLIMRKYRLDLILYSLFIIVFAVYKGIEVYWPSIPIVHMYLEDFLALPIILKSAQLVIQIFASNHRHFEIGLPDIAFITVLVAVYFELILPRYDPRFTADLIDVLIYGSGAWVYWRYMNGQRTDSASF